MEGLIKWSMAISLFIVQTAIQGQNFIDTTKQWTTLADIEYNPPNPHHYVTNIFKFSGDSVLNGKTYHKLYESNDSNQKNRSLNSLWYERDDSVFQYHSPAVDILVYDFNIQQGDSFYTGHDYMKVDSIRYLQWGGSLRKHWFFCKTNSDCAEQYYRTIWIQGVGQLGLLTRSSEIGIMGAYVQLLCFRENGKLVYHNPDFNSCYINTSFGLILNDSKKVIKVFPSDNGKIIIDNPHLEKGTIVFYSVVGNQINVVNITSDKTQIDLNKSGMTIYKFTSINGKTQSGKFINVSERLERR